MPTFTDIEDVGKTGGYTFDAGKDPSGLEREYRVEYYIQLKPTAPWATVEPRQWLLDDRLPQYLSSYSPQDSAALLRGGSIRRDASNRLKLLVEYIFSPVPPSNAPFNQVLPGQSPPSNGPSGGSGNPSDDPTQYAPKWTRTYETIEVPMVKDWSTPAKRVVNTAGDRFEPLPTRPMQIAILTYTRWEKGWQETTWDIQSFRVNKTLWFGNLPRTVLMMPPTVGEYKLVGNVLFYPVTRVFKRKVNEENSTWDIVLDNYGFRELKNGKVVDIVLAAGRQGVLHPLRANGSAIPQNLVGTEAPAQSTFLRYQDYEFADMNIKMPPYE